MPKLDIYTFYVYIILHLKEIQGNKKSVLLAAEKEGGKERKTKRQQIRNKRQCKVLW